MASIVLGLDKTYNLGQMHITANAYEHLAVTRRYTRDQPIFAGPLFIHGISDYKTYSEFFSMLVGALSPPKLLQLSHAMA